MLHVCSAVAIAFLALPILQQRSLLTNMSSVFPVFEELNEVSIFAASALKQAPGPEDSQKNQKLLMQITDKIESWMQSLANREYARWKLVVTSLVTSLHKIIQ